MKFTYDKPDTETREVKAILCGDTWLYQRMDNGYTVSSKYSVHFDDRAFDDLPIGDSDVLFYSGDSVTITF